MCFQRLNSSVFCFQDVYVDSITGEEEPVTESMKYYLDRQPEIINHADEENPIKLEHDIITIDDSDIDIDPEIITIDDKENPIDVTSQFGSSDELEFVTADPNYHNSASNLLPLNTIDCQKIEEETSENKPLSVPQQNVSKLEMFNCFNCQKSFTSSKSLKRHQRHKHGSGKDCSGESDSIEKQPESKKTKRFNCDECDSSFTTKQSLDLHKIRKHLKKEESCMNPLTKRFSCTLCAKSYKEKLHLILHKLNVHGREKDRSAKQSLSDSNEMQSRQSHSNNSKVSLTEEKSLILHGLNECDNENEASIAKSPSEHEHASQLEHVSSQDSVFHCQQCKKSFTSNKALVLHQRHKHGRIKNQSKKPVSAACKQTGSSLKPFTCYVCGRRCTTKLKLASHLQVTHFKQKPFQCSECGVCFADATSLSKHHRNHLSDKKLYNCPHCKRSFSVKTLYDTHVATHNFKCDKCDKTFHRKLNLAQHSLTHLSAKSFHCPHCSRQFDRKTNLLTHLKTHSPKHTHHCSECGEAFDAHSSLIQHLKAHLAVLKK